MVERPLGQLIEAEFVDDTVRGLVLTDAMIGIHVGARIRPSPRTRCFLYHMIGNGDGAWIGQSVAWGRSPLSWFEWRKRPRSRFGRAAG